MYVPIVLAGVFFSWPGGILAGVIAGILTGPYMPLDTLTGEAQVPLNWIIRMGFYALVGGMSGGIVNLLAEQLRRTRWIATHTVHTKLHNRFALEGTLQDRLDSAGKPFYFIAFSVDNFDQMAETFGYSATDEIIKNINQRLHEAFPQIEYFSNYHPQKIGIIIENKNSG